MDVLILTLFMQIFRLLLKMFNMILVSLRKGKKGPGTILSNTCEQKTE